MDKLYQVIYSIMMGGFLKGYRTQVLGYGTAIGAVLWGVVQWAVGDVPTATLFELLKEKWPLIIAGYGLGFLGDKVDAKKE